MSVSKVLNMGTSGQLEGLFRAVAFSTYLCEGRRGEQNSMRQNHHPSAILIEISVNLSLAIYNKGSPIYQ
jgi:hypothetical protein